MSSTSAALVLVEDIEQLLTVTENKQLADEKDGRDENHTKCHTDVEELQNLLKQLNVSVHTIADKSAKDLYVRRSRNFQTRIGALQRSALIHAKRARPAIAISKTATEEEDRGLAMLHVARAQLAETEQVGVSILQALDTQHQTIRGAHSNLQTAQGKLNDGDGLLSQMGRWWRG
jgi:hypothetical protein